MNPMLAQMVNLRLFGSEGEVEVEETAPPPETPPTEPDTLDPQDTFPRPYVEQLRTEAAASRTRAKALEAKLKEYEDRDLSEMDRAKKEAEDATAERESLRAELISTKRESLVHRLALELHFNDPSDAIALLPTLEPGEDGLPSEKAIKGALQTILKDKPYLAATSSPGGGDGGGRGGPPAPPPDEKIQEYQAEIEKKGGVRLPNF